MVRATVRTRMNRPDRQAPQGSLASVPRSSEAARDTRTAKPQAARSAAVTMTSAPSAHRTWRPARKTRTVTATTNAAPVGCNGRARECLRAVRQHSRVQGQRRHDPKRRRNPQCRHRARDCGAAPVGNRDQILQRDRGENRERKLHENDVSGRRAQASEAPANTRAGRQDRRSDRGPGARSPRRTP